MGTVIELYVSPVDDVVRGFRRIADEIEQGKIPALTHAVVIFQDEADDIGLTLLGSADEKGSLGLTMLGTQMLTNAVLGVE